MTTPASIRVVVIIGTVRPGSYTAKAAALVANQLRSQPGLHVDVVDPATLRLDFPGLDSGSGDGEVLRKTVSQATGVIIATPEYHGSFSSVTKLVIENLGFPSLLAGKPVALLGVAAGQIGAIKSLEALASVCLHIGAIVLPGSVSVAGVQAAFDQEGNCLNPGVEKRVRALATNLLDYVHGSICPRMTLEAMAREKQPST